MIIIIINCLVGDEMKHCLHHLASRPASKWDQQYGLTLHWIHIIM